jgi:hypothetical protein
VQQDLWARYSKPLIDEELTDISEIGYQQLAFCVGHTIGMDR